MQFWDVVKGIWSVVWKIGLAILILIMLDSCSKEEEKRRNDAKEKMINNMLEQLEENGVVSDYMDYEEGIYIRIPHYLLERVEHLVEGETCEFASEEYFDYLDEASSVIYYIYEELPYGY